MRNFPTLRDFTKFLDDPHKGYRFPLKIMGNARPTTASMLAYATKDVLDPSTNPTPIITSFGKIEDRGAMLEPSVTYSAISPNDDGHNVFQGDVVEISMDAKGPPYSMVVSQSCDTPTSQSFTVTLCPIFLEGDLTQERLEALMPRPKPYANAHAVASSRRSLLNNENVKFATFPPHPDPSKGGQIDESFAVALHFPFRVDSTDARLPKPLLRLTFRALSFLQWRIGTLYLRDVERSDDSRDF